MNDFAFVAIILAFFAVAALFVVACDRIIGADDESMPGVFGAGGRTGEGCGMSGDDIVGLIIAVALLAYLVFALVAPEKL